MIIAKTTVFFTALAVSTFSAISAQTSSTPVDDLVVEIDTAISKTTKMPRNKKGKKGGKAVHTKSEKKGKKSTSLSSSPTGESTSPSSSPTGVCEQAIVLIMAFDISENYRRVADYKILVDADPTLKDIPQVGLLLDQAASINSATKSTLYGDATGCDYDASLELFDLRPSRRHLEEEDFCSTLSASEVGRKLQDDPFAVILVLAEQIIRLFLSAVIEYDKLTKNYAPFVGLLGEIACAYYELSLAVVDIVKLLSSFTGNTIDLASFHEGVLKCTLIVYEEGDFFTEVFHPPTVFDVAACGL